MKLLIFMIVGFLSLMVSIKLSGQEITSIQDSFKVSGSAGIQLLIVPMASSKEENHLAICSMGA
ncbi:MAG: hypothetical protein IPN55_09410 [Saprospiraceae bacterium]|nr:hypothetical protein [Candidatus Brachybacter algidus]